MNEWRDPSSPFHDVGAIFPDDVSLVTVEPAESIVSALGLMLERRFSQLPVIDGEQLVGVFSLWSLAAHIAAWPSSKFDDLTVGDVLERLPTVTVEDPLDGVLEHLDRHDAALVFSPHGLQAVVTAFDVLTYFYAVARPFVLIQEIELGLRDLLGQIIASEDLAGFLASALQAKYQAQKRPVPGRLDEMTFEDARTAITSRDNWNRLDGAIPGTREMISTRLNRIRDIRNKVFHFRGSVTIQEYQALVTTRDWLLRARSRSPREAGGEKR
jgi:CBS domain-containing protein